MTSAKLPAFQRPVLVGQKWRDKYGELRIMGIAERYAMVRRKHCAPFVLSVRDIQCSASLVDTNAPPLPEREAGE